MLNEVEIYYHVKYTDTCDKISELKNKMKEYEEKIDESENGSESSNTSNISLTSDCKALLFL